MAFEGIFWRMRVEHELETESVRELIEFFRELFGMASNGLALLAPQFLRALTFELLEMRHACGWLCDSKCDPIGINEEEIQKIRDEDAEAIERFERLVPELFDTFWASGMSLVRICSACARFLPKTTNSTPITSGLLSIWVSDYTWTHISRNLRITAEVEISCGTSTSTPQ